jgi:ATP-dependent helicase/nuclease subunit B
MQTILGPFHPFLEDALVREILSAKNADPLNPLLIVVPSTALRRRLKVLLSRERKLSLLSVQLCTFYQLSLRLYDEACGKRPEPRGDLFFEEALRRMIRARQDGAAAFAGLDERVGGCAALWQTLRDLRDGLVKPEIALAALSEQRYDNHQSGRTAGLLRLLETLLAECRTRAIYSFTDIEKSLIEQVPAAKFLQQFTALFYYGFYDLTQLQVDLFHAVAKSFPTTLSPPRFFSLSSAQEITAAGVLPRDSITAISRARLPDAQPI